MTILHETQHVRISHFSILTFGKLRYDNNQSHKVMLNNMNSGGTYNKAINSLWNMPTGNGIYDFNAERWQFLKENALPGETDTVRDKEAYETGISELKYLGR